MTQPNDTSAEVRRRQREVLRSLTPAQRVQMAIEMSEVAAEISRAGAERGNAERRIG